MDFLGAKLDQTVERIDAWGPDPPPEECKDEGEFCVDWAAQGECDNNPDYMHESCKKSCKLCMVGDEGGVEGEGESGTDTTQVKSEGEITTSDSSEGERTTSDSS
jgi:hypothetical protein